MYIFMWIIAHCKLINAEEYKIYGTRFWILYKTILLYVIIKFWSIKQKNTFVWMHGSYSKNVGNTLTVYKTK